jgi:hypothetical protein
MLHGRFAALYVVSVRSATRITALLARGLIATSHALGRFAFPTSRKLGRLKRRTSFARKGSPLGIRSEFAHSRMKRFTIRSSSE